MILLFWTSLLFSVRDNVGVRADLKENCIDGYCVTLHEEVIAAESGLCVVIPCSFKTGQDFTAKHILWYKCEQVYYHQSSRLIYSSDKSSTIDEAYRGRVSLLVSDVSQRNCSIIINDLSQSDSGSYQLRVKSKWNGYTYPKKQVISVKGLSQKPNLDVPQLTGGQQTTLTCTAPGLCSGSEPTISWKWKDKRRNQGHIEGSVTAHMNVPRGALMRRYNSTLTFKASPEHHSSSVTCTVTFKNHVTTEVTKTLEVQYPPSNPKLSMNTEVTEGQKITISCVVDSFPPSTLTLIRETQSSSENMFSNSNSYEPHNNELVRTFSAASHHTGRYKCRASNTEGSTTSTQRDLVVKYKPKNLTVDVEPRDVKENTSVTFKCAAQSHPPVTSVTWTKSTDGKEEVLTRPQTFTLQSIAPTDSGRYRCRATNEVGSGESPAVDVQVKYAPKEIKIVKAQEQQLPDKRRSVMLTCSTRSYPRIHQYSWYMRSTDDGDVKLSQEQNHTVDSDKPGIYFCAARNEMGEKMSDTVEMFPEGVFVRVLKYLSLSVSLLFIPFAACLIYKYKRRFKREADHPAEKLQEVQAGSPEEESVNYASVYFTNKQPRQDVVYAVESKPRRLNKPTQDTDSSEEEDEVTYARVTFTDNRPNGKTSKSRRCEEETEYSTVKI